MKCLLNLFQYVYLRINCVIIIGLVWFVVHNDAFGFSYAFTVTAIKTVAIFYFLYLLEMLDMKSSI